MARRPKANSHDNTVRNLIIGFCVIVAIVAAALVWNNQSLSYAGTVNGERMPVAHLNFYQNQAWDHLIWNEGWPPGADTQAWSMALAYESLLELHITTARAAGFGITMANVDSEEVEARMAMLRMIHERPDMDIFANMGFNNAGFRRFVELQALHELVYNHVAAQATIDLQEVEDALEDFMVENHMNFTNVLVHLVEVETQEQAEALHRRLFVEGDSVEFLMVEYSLAFHEEFLDVDDDGQLITAMNVDFTILGWDEEQRALAYAMEIGDVSEVLELMSENFGFFQVVDIESVIEDLDGFKDGFRADFEHGLRNEFFRARLAEWADEAVIVPNGRIIDWE